MSNLFIVFCVLNIVNVILQTVKSLVTVKCGKWLAAVMNAVAFGLYQVIIVYAVCDLPLIVKIAVVAIANFIGVFCTKLVEEKMRKDRLWKVEVTVPAKYQSWVHDYLRDVPHSFIPIGNHTLFNFYCATQKESQKVKNYCNQYGAKYFVSESKTL